MRKVAILGLGRFGMSLARNLGATDAQVIAIDSDSALVNEVKDYVDLAVRLDSTDERALAAQAIDKVDVCVIAIGNDFEAALLTTVVVKKLGVPIVICRAQSEYHAQIFRQIGADEIVQPETQAGQHLARRLANPHVEDVITLAEGFSLVEMQAPASFWGKSLRELDLRAKYHVNLVAIKRLQKNAVPSPGDESEDKPEDKQKPRIPRFDVSVPKPEDRIQEGDVLVFIGSDAALSKLPQQ